MGLRASIGDPPPTLSCHARYLAERSRQGAQGSRAVVCPGGLGGLGVALGAWGSLVGHGEGSADNPMIEISVFTLVSLVL